MASTMRCEIVSAEKQIFSGEVTMVVAVGTLGELGIMPGHTPLLTGLQPSTVRLKFEDGTEEPYYVSGGFLEVQPHIVTVLADTAEHAADIDEAAAIAAQEEAQKAMSDQAAEIDLSRASAMLADATARQKTIEELRKRRS